MEATHKNAAQRAGADEAGEQTAKTPQTL